MHTLVVGIGEIDIVQHDVAHSLIDVVSRQRSFGIKSKIVIGMLVVEVKVGEVYVACMSLQLELHFVAIIGIAARSRELQIGVVDAQYTFI